MLHAAPRSSAAPSGSWSATREGSRPETRDMTQPSIIELTGRIDNATSADIETRINAALDGEPSALVLDFSGVTFVSSIGLRVLLLAAKRCRKQNARLALHSVSPQIVDLFGVSGLTRIFPVHDSRDAALAASVASG